MSRNAIRFLRNGKLRDEVKFDPNETLLDYLRLRERACGTKEGCAEGDCGACTVAIGRLKEGRLVYEPVNSCIQLMGQISGKDIITIDDLADGDTLHSIQQEMVEHHASQCGFCTPGIIMSLFTLYHSDENANRENVGNWLSGNLCRCTGYRPIVDAAIAALDVKAEDFLTARYAATQNALQNINDGGDIRVGSGERFFAIPKTLPRLAQLCKENPEATILSGATDVGLWITKQLRDLPKIIYTGAVKDFAKIYMKEHELHIGAGASYEEIFESIRNLDSDFGEIIRRIGSKPVRASGTIGGNIANGSPIGDMPPALIALNARLNLQLGKNTRQINLEDFFIDYGKQDRVPGEIVTKIVIPPLAEKEHFRAYKISKRFDQDISSVLAAFKFGLQGRKVKYARLAYGGMAGIPMRATVTEEALSGINVDNENAIGDVLQYLENDFTPLDDMRASANYRLKVAKNLLRKALYEISSSQSRKTRILGYREAAQ